MIFGRRLGTRIALTVALAVAGTAIGLSVLAYELDLHGSKDRFAQSSLETARSDFRQAAAAARGRPAPEAARAVEQFIRERSVRGYRIGYENPGRQSDGFLGSTCVDDRFPHGMDTEFNPTHRLRTAWMTLCDGAEYLAVYGAPVAGVSLAEFFDFPPLREQLAHLRNVLIWVTVGGLVLAGVLGTLVGRRIARPVQHAARTARELGDGDLSVRMPVAGRQSSELSELGEAFNDMAAKLQESQAQQRRFVADVAHELRTPLAAMLAAADGVSSSDPSRRRRSAELLGGQTRRLTRLVDDLLEISRFDAGQARLELEEVDLEELVLDAVQTVAPHAAVSVAAVGSPAARVDPRRVHTIVRNLVANAVQHGAAPVRVDVADAGSDVTIAVTDAGPGVPAELAPVVFDRFVRGDRSRSSDGDGTAGLGLAIAAENAALHGGSLTLDPARPNRFVVRLPRGPARLASGINPAVPATSASR